MKCCLCDTEIEVLFGWAEGHNAEPLKNGRCCGDCNSLLVIPARLMILDNKKEEAVK
jgi:hypothetical protein